MLYKTSIKNKLLNSKDFFTVPNFIDNSTDFQKSTDRDSSLENLGKESKQNMVHSTNTSKIKLILSNEYKKSKNGKFLLENTNINSIHVNPTNIIEDYKSPRIQKN